MKLNIMAKKIQIGPSFSEYAEKKLNQKLDKKRSARLVKGVD